MNGTDWKAIADLLAQALRQCQVPPDWPMAWPDGMSEGTPWVDDALAAYEAARPEGRSATGWPMSRDEMLDALEWAAIQFARSYFAPTVDLEARLRQAVVENADLLRVLLADEEAGEGATSGRVRELQAAAHNLEVALDLSDDGQLPRVPRMSS